MNRARHALTLVEIILVLALLVVVGSLARPILESGFSSVRLRRATDQLLAAWSETRARAIESGQIQQFRFQPETGTYRSEPWYHEEVVPAIAEAAKSADPSADPKLQESETELPDEIVFVEGEALEFDTVAGSQLASLTQGETGVWSNPILFFPDGTSSPAAVLLRNDRRVFQRVTLRALMGIGRASDLLSEDEAERQKFR